MLTGAGVYKTFGYDQSTGSTHTLLTDASTHTQREEGVGRRERKVEEREREKRNK